MTWLLVGVVVWIVVAIPTALVIGRAVRAADARRPRILEAPAEANFVATDSAPSQIVPADEPQLPWTGPATLPFPPPPAAGRQRPSVVRHPVTPVERAPSTRDSGVF